MSDDYSEQIRRIRKAASLEEVQAIAREFPAKAVGEGGILYSRPVGSVSSESIALELASKTGEPIINHTPRAQFLGDKQVEKAIRDTAERIFMGQGQDLAQAGKSAGDLLYGNPNAAARSATSLEGSLWGEASHEFAGSLRGDIKVIASNANIERVFGKVELPAVLDNPNVRTLGGQPTAELKTLYAKGGADAVLPKVQAQFIEAAPKGIFVAPENTGAAVTKVTLSREAVASLGADAAKFTPAAELSGAGLARAPTGLTAPAASVGEAALTGEAAGVARGLRPGTVMKGAAVVGAAALAYDFVTTGHQVMKLESQGNTTGAESARTHFIGRNVGGIGGGIAGGFLAGAGYGLVAGSETGPGALVTGAIGGIAGGIGGAVWGEKWAQQKDIDRVFTQKDRDGNEWSRDPKDEKATWTRVAQTEQVKASTTVGADNAAATYSKVRYVAGDVLANELNYKSANASYELGLSNARKPQDPYSIPPGKTDTPSLGGGDWTRDAQSHAWKREVVTDYLEHGIKVSHTETANPQRAAELDQSAKLIVAENAANTPAAVAARYQVAYNQFGWKQNGDVPAAIKDAAAKTESLQASDGDTYTRGANGEWTTPGMIYGTNQASGNVRDELNGIHQSQRVGLQELSAVAAEALAHPTLPQPMTMRGMVAGAYANAGVARTPEQIDAATAAVAQTHAHNGLDRGGRPYSLTLQPDPKTGRPGQGSAIVTMMDDGRDGLLSESKMVPKAITTAAEIKQAEKPAVDGQAPAPRTDGKNQGAATPAGGPQSREHASNPLQQLPSTDQAMFAKIRGGAPPQVSDDHVAHAMLLAKKDGIPDATKIENVKMSGDTLWVAGTTPGFKASVNVNEAVPPTQETARETLAFNQQRDRQPTQENPQRHQSQAGPSV
ncbi:MULTISPECIES: hypothetical protein [unclassified Lysobacter]|uniref:hypothetical protein n=1 Tax=unclassified Lysobacter TaxID=2635362 RepID=UPI001BE55BA6|nr:MULTISPECIES: hypothetical protein [unclassified Lysobacter]MBT2745318.1 hypothetical protein [Lysobacter sp. ISL-42]MBT2751915.1 hypothetical protein [Lysobacter sp. ISL-50]MBT2777880.1 hypothetical protein [Lysobacter sp. ISL-54]MBT2783136.1 hypothetical protein [Lysobacter sp. ISL-52]